MKSFQQFLSKLYEDKWFIFANLTLFAMAGYLVNDIWSKYTFKQQKEQNTIHSKHLTSSYNKFKGKLKKNQFPIFKICITGGPCAGKRTALATLRQVLQNRGFRVFVIPQTPTMLINAGGMIMMNKLSNQQIVRFQTELIKYQIYIEDYFSKLAEMTKNQCVILWQQLLISNRGVMDPFGYVTNQIWQTIIDQEDWNIINLRDKRYDAIIFMVTAADGAEKYYTFANNQAWHQSIESAIAIDKRIQEAYIGHPHLQQNFMIRIIDNKQNEQFKEKINAVIKTVEKFIGIPFEKIEKKFLIKKFQNQDLPQGVHIQQFNVEETFLINKQNNKEGSQKQLHILSYNLIQKLKKNQTSSTFVLEIKTMISAQQYMMMLMRADQSMNSIKKKRMSILYKKNVFIVDVLMDEKVYLLRCESKENIPDFIKIEKDVTDLQQFKTQYFAKKKQYKK